MGAELVVAAGGELPLVPVVAEILVELADSFCEVLRLVLDELRAEVVDALAAAP
jgi:hypothetical protein